MSGATGASGLSGVSGATGASGVSGATGASGTSGASGVSGASGFGGNIQNDGTGVTPRPIVNFTGGLAATDDAGNGRTNITLDCTVSPAAVCLTGNQTVVGAKVFSPTADVTGLVVRQTSAGTPTSAIFAVQDNAGSTTFLSVNASGNTTIGGTSTTISNLGSGILHANASGVLTSSAVDLASADVTGLLPAASVNNTGTGSFLVNVPGTNAANTVAPTADVSALLVRQTSAGSPSQNVFAILNSGATQSFVKVDSAGNTTIGNSTVVSGNTLTIETGATTGTALNVNTGSTTGNAVNVATSTTTGNAVNIQTGNGVTSGPGDVSGSALNVNTGSSTFSNGSDLSLKGGAINVESSGVFGGALNEASLVRIQSTGNFTGTLVRLVADNTSTGTILGISGTSLTTGRAVDVSLGSLYSGQTDAQGSIGAVNIRSGAYTGNILSVSSTAAGAGASSNLVNVRSPQIDGRLLHVNMTGNYGGAGAVAINASGNVTGTIQNVTANSATTGTLMSLSGTGLTTGTGLQVAIGSATNGGGADPAVQKAEKLILGTAGTGIYANTAAAYVGNFLDLRVDGAQKFALDQTGSINMAGGITTAGNFSQTGATTFSTGTGNVSLNGNVSIATDKNFIQNGAGTFSTGTGAVSLNGDVTVAAGKTVSISHAGTISGTLTTMTANSTATGTILGINANALTTGKAIDVNLGASGLTGNTGAVSVRGTGAITGTVTALTANAATTGTILGINGTGLSTGKALAVDLGASTLASNTGAVEVTSTGVIASGATVARIAANSATTGTLLAVSGTALTTGVGLDVATGTPGGTDPAVAKAIRVGLGTTGTALYANATTGYTGSFLDFRINGGTPVLTVSETGAITTAGNFSQTGATTFSTGTGAVSLNGNTTVTGTNTFAVSGGLATFGGGLTISAGNFTQSGSGTFSTGTGQVTVNGPLTVTQAALQGGVLVSSAAGVVNAVAPGANGNVLTSNGTTWVSQAPGLRVLDKQAATVLFDISETTEVTIYSTTIPANSLGTGNVVRIRMHGTIRNDSGLNRIYTLYVKYGGVTFFGEATPNIADTNALARAFTLDVDLAANGSTGAQTVSGQFMIANATAPSVAGTGDFGLNGPILGPTFVGTGSVDSTVAQTFAVTIDSSNANATQELIRYYVSTELTQ